MLQHFIQPEIFIAAEFGLLDWEKNPVHIHSSLMVGAATTISSTNPELGMIFQCILKSRLSFIFEETSSLARRREPL